MAARSVRILTTISLAALSLAACNTRLAPSQDAPSGPPLRVDLIHPGDQPEGPPLPPADAPAELVEAVEPADAPGAEDAATPADAPAAQTPAEDAPAPIAPPVALTPVADPEPPVEAPRVTPIAVSHCRADERPLYNCPFTDGRVLSVCAGDQIAYRFGRPAHPELELVRDPQSEGLSYSRVRRGDHAGQTRLRFQNGAYDYVVYSADADVHSEDRRAGDSGVVVRRSGREVGRFECPSASTQTMLPVAMLRDTVRQETGQRRRRGWW